MPRKRIVSFRLRLVAMHHNARRNDTSNAARPCSSRYVAMRSTPAPQTLAPKCLDHLTDEFFFKFLVNFRPCVFVFARQLVVKFRHIAAAFAVELDRVSPYGAVF